MAPGNIAVRRLLRGASQWGSGSRGPAPRRMAHSGAPCPGPTRAWSGV